MRRHLSGAASLTRSIMSSKRKTFQSVPVAGRRKKGSRGPLKGQEGIGRPKAPVPVSKRPSWPMIFAEMHARQCTAGQALDHLLNG